MKLSSHFSQRYLGLERALSSLLSTDMSEQALHVIARPPLSYRESTRHQLPAFFAPSPPAAVTEMNLPPDSSTSAPSAHFPPPLPSPPTTFCCQ
ncbi:hypothetical protein J6590_008160 [Homalodisca vitripennis]|nr:hypothetical protein J6590_008160 [Homalodisca vitripennis]